MPLPAGNSLFSGLGWSPIFYTDASTMASASTRAPSIDTKIRAARFAQYPILNWYCVVGFIILLPFCRLLVYAIRCTRGPPSSGVSRTRRTINWRRLPAAFVHTFRAIAFRWTFSIGKSCTLNVAQCFVTAAYMATLLTWTFANCKAPSYTVIFVADFL